MCLILTIVRAFSPDIVTAFPLYRFSCVKGKRYFHPGSLDLPRKPFLISLLWWLRLPLYFFIGHLSTVYDEYITISIFKSKVVCIYRNGGGLIYLSKVMTAPHLLPPLPGEVSYCFL